MASREKRKIFESLVPLRERFCRKNHYYYDDLRRFYQFHVPAGRRVLEIGCASGDLLAALKPSFGVGLDFCREQIRTARRRHPGLHFIQGDAEALPVGTKFDYIVISDVLESLDDIQTAMEQLRACCHPATRVICNFFNNLWEPVLKFGEWAGIKIKNPVSNWLAMDDMKNLFYLSGFDVVSRGHRILFPREIPLVSTFLNRVVGNMPLLHHLCLTQYLVVRPQPEPAEDWQTKYSVSVLIPTRDEAGNIPGCFTRTPKMGKWTELIFVDGNSTDGTVEAIEQGLQEHGAEWERAILIPQGTGRGKGDAVRKGFAAAKGDILMILDSDLTMPPEDLPKYYDAIARGKGEFINGCRLVYPMEEKAMRFINFLGNKTFGMIFTWLLQQRLKDTLCGTKVLWRKDYEDIAANRHYFGDFDPFGDFDLIFGAAKLDRKIVDLPIKYRERVYGEIKIERWKHAALLFKMCGVALRRLKLQ